MARNIRIIKDELNPETPEVLAASLISIAKSFEKIMSAKDGLTRDAIVALLFHMKGNTATKPDIRLILDNLTRLKSYYIRKPIR